MTIERKRVSENSVGSALLGEPKSNSRHSKIYRGEDYRTPGSWSRKGVDHSKTRKLRKTMQKKKKWAFPKKKSSRDSREVERIPKITIMGRTGESLAVMCVTIILPPEVLMNEGLGKKITKREDYCSIYCEFL